MTLLSQKNSYPFPPKNFINLQKEKLRRTKISHLKFNGHADIKVEVIASGIKVFINGLPLKLQYPESVWRRFPLLQKKIFADNVAYFMTMHLPFLFPTLKKMDYDMPVPLSEAFAYKSFTKALPAIAMMQSDHFGKLTSNLLRRFFYTDYIFNNKKTLLPPFNRTSSKENVVMPFTFGKDSLLTFALSRELGLNTQLIFIVEPHLPYDEISKRELSTNFQKEFRTNVEFLQNTLGLLREPHGWYGWELQLTQYSLLALPYVYATKAGYIFFSNEQSCDSSMIDSDGFKCNPVFEQSHQWLLQNSLMTSLIGGNSLSIGSILEPIHEIAIEKILHKRYGEIGKYQSSCDLEYKPKNGSRWCENCSKCARIYIFLLAHGINPKTVGFKGNMLREPKVQLFSMFNVDRIKEFGYDNTETAAEEQILAFLMAYRRGVKGAAMETFKKRYLKYATSKEKKLRNTYFGIHSTTTIPKPLLKKVLSIYHEELDSLK